MKLFKRKHLSKPMKMTMEKKGDQITEKKDLISELPEEILHLILSFLAPKHAASTIILSKRWKTVCDSLDFYSKFPTASEANCSKIDMGTFMSTITDLCLAGYSLGLSDHSTKLFFRKLTLKDIIVEDKNLHQIVSNCCVLEELNLNFSKRLITGCYHRGGLPSMPVCTTLKKLSLEIPKMTASWFQEEEIMAKFPLLEDLKLVRCYNLRNVSISSPKLRRLGLIGCHHLKDVKIDARRLEVFEYSGHCAINFSSSDWDMETPCLMEATIEICPRNHRDLIWLLKLIGFLDTFNSHKGLVCKLDEERVLTSTNVSTCMELSWSVKPQDIFRYEQRSVSKPLSLDWDRKRMKYMNLSKLKKHTLLSISWHGRYLEKSVTFPEELKGSFLPPLKAIDKLKLQVLFKPISYKDLVDALNWISPHPKFPHTDASIVNTVLENLCFRTLVNEKYPEEYPDWYKALLKKFRRQYIKDLEIQKFGGAEGKRTLGRKVYSILGKHLN